MIGSFWHDDSNVYVVSSSGINIFSLSNLDSISGFVPLAVTPNVIHGNGTDAYISTVSGVYIYDTISGTLNLFKEYPYSVNYIFVSDTYACVVTDSGVDRIKLSDKSIYSISEPEATKCFQTSSGGFYYLKNPVSGPCKLVAVYDDLSSFEFTSGDGVLLSNHTVLNDVFISEDKSVFGGHVIALATDYGAVIIEERRGNELNCRRKYYLRNNS